MFSMKTKYALRALSMLSREYGNGTVSITEIARKENIPKRFLVNILQELKTLGIVNSLMGKNGGYFLTQAPEKISLLSVIQLCEQSIGLMDCVSETHPGDFLFCKDLETCKTRSVFSDIRDYTIRKLQETTLLNI